MKALVLLTAAALSLPMVASAQQQTTVFISTQGHSADAPPAGFQGQWFTTSDGCTYSRTQAPGYPVQWIIVLNPRHIGQPNAHRGCKPMI
ncbi:hypothetical protein [Roseivivax sp. CAU 1753]